MARGTKIKIEKEVLSWARNSIGFSLEEASRKTTIPANNLEKWEKESSEIYLSDIKKIARKYKRQLSFFFLPSAPKEKPIPSDFRTLDSVKQDDISEKIRLAIRRAQANRKIISEFFLDEYKLKINKPITLTENATEVGKKFRTLFNIKTEDQFSLKDEKKALAFWISKIEENGIPVFQMDLDEKFKGFCLRENDLPPVIVVNSKDARNAKVFTIMHEFCHLFINQFEIDQQVQQSGEKRAHMVIEAFANEFAGSFLVPNSFLQADDLYNSYRKTRDDNLITKLSKKFAVSESVIFRRMYSLGVITKKYYDLKTKEIDFKFKQIKIAQRAKMKANPNSHPVRNVPRETLQKLGLSLSSNAFQAVSEGKMTTFDLVRFLDIKTKHISGVQNLLEKKYLSLS